MQCSKGNMFLLLLLSWLSVLVSASGIPVTIDDRSGDHRPAEFQQSSPVHKRKLGQLPNAGYVFDSFDASSSVAPAFKHENVVEIEKRKSRSSSNSNSPDTNSNSPESSSDDGGCNSVAGLQLNAPACDPTTSVENPDPFDTAPTITVTTAGSAVSSTSVTETSASNSIYPGGTYSNKTTTIGASVSGTVPNSTAAGPSTASPTYSSVEFIGNGNRLALESILLLSIVMWAGLTL